MLPALLISACAVTRRRFCRWRPGTGRGPLAGSPPHRRLRGGGKRPEQAAAASIRQRAANHRDLQAPKSPLTLPPLETHRQPGLQPPRPARPRLHLPCTFSRLPPHLPSPTGATSTLSAVTATRPRRRPTPPRSQLDPFQEPPSPSKEFPRVPRVCHARTRPP